METSTDRLAPRIIINEHDIPQEFNQKKKPPVTLLFGFSPIGRTNEPVYCNSSSDVYNEFGYPSSAPEKYFIDSALRLVENDATVIMNRLPYDNFQCHRMKFVDYVVGSPVKISDIATGPAESKMREKDDSGVTILKEMNAIDPLMNQYQRIEQYSSNIGIHIGHMSQEKLTEIELDPIANLDKNTFRIVDIKGQQYGTGSDNLEYTGIFPIITTAPMALYYQNKIQNSTALDSCFDLIDLSKGIEMSTIWYRQSNPDALAYKTKQSNIVNSIKQEINFNTATDKYHRNGSFQDQCVGNFPLINFSERNKLDKTNLKNIGLLVCSITWDEDQQISKLSIVESFVGYLGRGPGCIDRKINQKSKFIRMYKNLSIPASTDFLVINGQKMNVLGMQKSECTKYINYKTSIIDPITHSLESKYSDIDSLNIDVILDAGISSTAFAAYVAKNEQGETFTENETVRTKIDWTSSNYDIEDSIQDYATVWNTITRLFGDFIKSVRGDCVYIADGPRILNLERNYPIANYTDMDNIEMFNRYLPYFSGYTNNYVAKYWNWVYIEDLQYQNRGIWVPGSVVMGSQLAINDHNGKVWLAPAGQQRGIVPNAYNVSVRTKQYNSENDILYQNQWNFFQIYQNEGVVVEGQKTLQTKKTSLDRLNTRRMICYIKQQIRRISNRYKYEPNTKSMRSAYVSELSQMLYEIQRGYGISDYKIQCDDKNNTTQTIDRHELYAKIGVKPIKALEYIIIDLNVINGAISMDDSLTIKG